MNRAIDACEYVAPLTVTVAGVSVAEPGVGCPAAGPVSVGMITVSPLSHTSSGTTYVSSRMTLSTGTRVESALWKAATRLLRSADMSGATGCCSRLGMRASEASVNSRSPRRSSACADACMPRKPAKRVTAATTPIVTTRGSLLPPAPPTSVSRGRRLTARISPRSRGRWRPRTSPAGLVGSTFGPTLTRRKGSPSRIGTPTSSPDRLGEAVHVRRPARQHDLADAERARLGLVELERGDELARERCERALDAVTGLRDLLGGQSVDLGRGARTRAGA